LPRTIYELLPQFKVAGFFEALLSRWRNVAFLAQNMPFEAYRMRGGCTRRGVFWLQRCAARPREERDENEDIVYRPGIENWPRLSYLSVSNNIKQLGKT